MMEASREGDREVRLSSIRNLIPWCFACDNINYMRHLSSYLSEMSHLEDEHLDIFRHLTSGGFADNPLIKIAVDQACEESEQGHTNPWRHQGL